MKGYQLKEHLNRHGVTQTEFAKAIPLSHTRVSQLLSRKVIRPHNVARFTDALEKLGIPITLEEPKPSTFGKSEDHTTLVRITDLQREVSMLREMVEAQKKIIALLEEKAEPVVTGIPVGVATIR